MDFSLKKTVKMLEIIGNEMKKYNWDRLYIIEEETYIRVNVYFEECIIMFTYDKKYDSVDCAFKNEDTPWPECYYIEGIFESNGFDGSEIPGTYSPISINEYIKKFIELIYNHLLFVIDGDFSWIKRYDEINFNSNIIYEKMHKSSKFQGNAFDTDIYKKMLKGDTSWKTDLENFEDGSPN